MRALRALVCARWPLDAAASGGPPLGFEPDEQPATTGAGDANGGGRTRCDGSGVWGVRACIVEGALWSWPVGGIASKPVRYRIVEEREK